VQRLRAESLSLAQRPHAMVLFGQIDQVEVDAERAHELQQARRRLLLGPGEEWLVGRLAAAQLDGRGADVFDGCEEIGPALLAQDAPDEFAQQSYVVAQAIDRLGAYGHGGSIDLPSTSAAFVSRPRSSNGWAGVGVAGPSTMRIDCI
jgi:hypothetical protein